jgi:hypothetical protein
MLARLTVGNVAGTLLAGAAVAAVSLPGGDAADATSAATEPSPGARGAAAAASATAPQEAERYTLAGDRFAVHNLVGEVEIRRGVGSDLTVTVRRGGDDAGRLEIAIGEIDGRQTLRVLYPGDRVVYDGYRGETHIDVDDDGTLDGGGLFGGREVRITGDGSGLRAHADLVIEVPEGARLEVHTGVGGAAARGVTGDLSLDVASGGVEVRDHAGALEVDTGSGSVRVAGVRGDLHLDTGSGSVRVSDVEGERIGLDTGSGNVRGSGLTASELDADTGSGGIDLAEVSAPRLRLDTGSGSIRVGLLTDVDHLEADTGSGSVELLVPEDFGSSLRVETGSGGIDIDGLDVDVDHMGDDGFRGSVGDGRGETVIDTGSGSVRLRRG